MLVLCVTFSACATHEGDSPDCEVQDGASLSLTIMSRLLESNAHRLCFLLRGQHEFVYSSPCFSEYSFFVWCVEDPACTALLSNGAQSLAYANQVLDC